MTRPGSYAVDSLVASGSLPFAAVSVADLGLPQYHCPYSLPAVDSGETVILVSGWLHTLSQQGIDIISRALMPLRERFNVIAGLDQADPFQLDFSDQVMDLMDVVLKVNGVYTDRDLYNYVVGAPTPDGRWTEKAVRGESPYKLSNLKKLHLSIPCFLGTIPQQRALTRHFYSNSAVANMGKAAADRLLNRLPRAVKASQPPRYTAHFFASLSHIQRADAARALRNSSLRWKGGITSVPQFVTGYRGVGLARLSPLEQRELRADLAAEGLMVKPLNRLRYLLSMSDCKAVLSVTGYGELCFRMAEAWANRRVLVCQDLSHVRTMFPFENGGNVVYCKPDLSDLLEVLDDIECNFSNYVHVAERGYHDWAEWCRKTDDLLLEGFAPLYRD